MDFRRPLPVALPRAFSVREAYLNGMSRSQLRNAALVRPFHGARFAPRIDPELIDQCHAFSARMPRGAIFSHVTAARLHGMPLPIEFDDGPLHVMSPAGVRATKARGTVGHCATLGASDVTERQGIRLTTPERTWCDLAAILNFSDLVAAGDSLLWWEQPLTTMERLLEAAQRYPSQRGRSRMQLALGSLSPRSRSRPESIVRLALTASVLPEPVPNFEVYLPLSRREIAIDLAYPKYKVGLEYQGDHHRLDRRQWRRDVRRGNDAVDAGWSMIYFTGDDLVDLPDIVARTERRLRSRGWPVA
ncbi:type IV toxin-antitoxin system AbiEi family antitoxin domain-containing protein [Mycetocola miduiensis]|uniref:DUF559 domain-containing protein n=1 Tax=Mycetocola miduiensis TaxID=995034 RepID=A0A1I5DYH9_9MICO|nr:hypothetical protein [Mycetocola miduiensis]SFO04256.1 hypothetical protein SAMN05216219_3162 [Mycetocola miduiensis]